MKHAWFSVIDLKDSSWACPLAKERRSWFAFGWQDKETGRKQQLQWTQLPHPRVSRIPKFIWASSRRTIKTVPTVGHTQILQYIGDLLVSGEQKGQVLKTAVKLLNFLGEKGLKVSKKKLQFVEPEVKHLGHLIGKGYKKLEAEQI